MNMGAVHTSINAEKELHICLKLLDIDFLFRLADAAIYYSKESQQGSLIIVMMILDMGSVHSSIHAEQELYIKFLVRITTICHIICHNYRFQKARVSLWASRMSVTCDTLHYPAYTTRWPNAGLMLVQRRRRWANIRPALGQRVVFAGYGY